MLDYIQQIVCTWSEIDDVSCIVRNSVHLVRSRLCVVYLVGHVENSKMYLLILLHIRRIVGSAKNKYV